MIKFGFVLVLVLSTMTTGTALAQSGGGMKDTFEREISRWRVQQSAAERDIKFVNEVQEVFIKAAKPYGREPQIIEVNAALAALRKRYPDYRLIYNSSSDFCSISRAISDARASAGRRLVAALDKQLIITGLSKTYSRIMIKYLSSKILGELVSTEDIVAAFEEEVASLRKESLEIDWGTMDGLFEPGPGEDRCA